MNGRMNLLHASRLQASVCVVEWSELVLSTLLHQFSQVRDLVLSPPSQNAEHADHSPHSPNSGP